MWMDCTYSDIATVPFFLLSLQLQLDVYMSSLGVPNGGGSVTMCEVYAGATVFVSIEYQG